MKVNPTGEMKLHQLSIRVKLFIFLCVVSLLPLLLTSRVLTSLGGSTFQRLLDYQIKDGLDNTVASFGTIEGRLREAVTAVAHWEEFGSYFHSPNSSWIEENLKSWAPQSYGLDFLGIFDEEDLPLYIWTSSEPIELEYFQPLCSGEITARSGWISTPHGLYLVAASEVGYKGADRGTLLFGKRLTYKFLLEAHHEDREAEIMVYYGGRLIATTDTSSVLPYVDPAEIFSELVQRQGTYIYEAPEHNRVIGFRSLRNIHGDEVAAIGWSANQLPARFIQESIRRILFYFGIPLLALVLLAALFLGLWIEGPVRTLSETMEDVSRTGDLSKRAPVTGSSEMALMSKTFNQMLEQLANQHDELIRFRTMILAMKEGVLIEDTDSNIVYMNPRMEEMLGVSLEDILNREGSLQLDDMITSKGKRIEDERGFYTEEVEWIRPDAYRLQAIKTSGQLEDPNGNTGGVLSTFVDITERNDLEIELIEVSRMAFLGLFSQGVLHNISGPINSILGFSSLLCRKQEEAEIPQRIHTDAEKIAEQVTILGRRWHRTGTTTHEMLNLNELIQDEVKFLEADLFYKHNVEKNFDLDPGLPTIQGSYGDFSHALLNIIINSIDALLDSPIRELTIRSKYALDEIRLEIEDTGVGISPENINKIFLPFFSTKRRQRKEGIPSGAGLGLAIARKILEPYSVHFEVHSQVGSGTLVILHLPTEPLDEVERVLMESAEVNA